MSKLVDIQIDTEDKMQKEMKKQFLPQIKYDKRNNNLDSTSFSSSDKKNLKDYVNILKSYKKDITSYADADLEDSLNVETGQTYKDDVRDENLDQGITDKSYIKHHQDYFDAKRIYPMVDDIDWYPKPLTHKQFWLILNGEHFDTTAYDDVIGNVEA